MVPIEMNTVHDAVQLFRWLNHKTQRVNAILRESEGDREVRTLAEWLASRPEQTATARQLQRSNGKRYPDVETASTARDGPIDAGRADRTKRSPAEGRGGHTVVASTLRPTVRLAAK